MVKEPRSKSQFFQWRRISLAADRERKIQTIKKSIVLFLKKFLRSFWSKGLSTRQLEVCFLFKIQLAVGRVMNALVLWTLHPVKMLRAINQFLLLQKGVFTSRYLILFSVSFHAALFCLELPKLISHMIKNTAEVVFQPEIEHSDQSCLKLTYTFTIPLFWGYTYPGNVSLPKSSCSGRLVDFWPLPCRMEITLILASISCQPGLAPLELWFTGNVLPVPPACWGLEGACKEEFLSLFLFS